MGIQWKLWERKNWKELQINATSSAEALPKQMAWGLAEHSLRAGLRSAVALPKECAGLLLECLPEYMGDLPSV